MYAVVYDSNQKGNAGYLPFYLLILILNHMSLPAFINGGPFSIRILQTVRWLTERDDLLNAPRCGSASFDWLRTQLPGAVSCSERAKGTL